MADDSWGAPRCPHRSDREAERAADRERRARERIAAAEARTALRQSARDGALREREAAREARRQEEEQRRNERIEERDARPKRRASGSLRQTGEERLVRDVRHYATAVDHQRIVTLARRGATVAGLATVFGISEAEVEAILADEGSVAEVETTRTAP